MCADDADNVIIPTEISTSDLISTIKSSLSTTLSRSPLRHPESKSQDNAPDNIAAQAITLLQSLPASDQSSTRAPPPPSTSDDSHLPLTTLHRLLSTILKPLFSPQSHTAPSFSSNSRLTASGRKNPFPNSASLINTRFSSNTFALLDESAKPWKFAAPWSTSLLFWVLSQYTPLNAKTKKDALDTHFPLLVPPILTLIDDEDTHSKASGCTALERFADLLQECQSNLLERTGLADVFIDALVPTMSLLPTLTPEKESILVLGALYPAFRSVISARWPLKPSPIPHSTASASTSTSAPTLKPKAKTNPLTSPPPPNLLPLNTLLRHGLIHSFPYTHPNSPPLTSLLLHQLTLTLPLLGIHSARYLKELIPLLASILTNPFAATAGAEGVEMLRAAVAALRGLLGECAGRFEVEGGKGGVGDGNEGWALEVLRACVGCWMRVVDDEREHEHEHENERKRRDAKKATRTRDMDSLEVLKRELKDLVRVLKEAAPHLDTQGHLRRLVEVEGALEELLLLEG
ncbi:MAG: hypothetical protein Q9160_003436 [Pyrenula sp. 1 TL-2023]